MDKKETVREMEEKLIEEIIWLEGFEAIGVKPAWNWQNCKHYDYCPKRVERKERERTVDCLFNPKMFRCPAYQSFERKF